MTADLTRLDGLRYRAGATQVALDAFELDHPDSHLVPELRERHNELLRQNQESKDWLMIAQANLDGRMNFTPKLSSEQTKTKKRKTTATN